MGLKVARGKIQRPGLSRIEKAEAAIAQTALRAEQNHRLLLALIDATLAQGLSAEHMQVCCKVRGIEFSATLPDEPAEAEGAEEPPTA